MCDSFRLRAGRTCELPCSTNDPPSVPRLHSLGIRPRVPVHDPREISRRFGKSGAPLLVHPAPELVPAVPDMFVTPSWFTAATSACSIFEQRLRAILQHHAITGKLQHGRTHEIFWAPRADRRYSSACHSARSSYCRPPKGPWKKIPFHSRRRETLGPYRTDERSARIPSTLSDRQRSRGRQ